MGAASNSRCRSSSCGTPILSTERGTSPRVWPRRVRLVAAADGIHDIWGRLPSPFYRDLLFGSEGISTPAIANSHDIARSRVVRWVKSATISARVSRPMEVANARRSCLRSGAMLQHHHHAPRRHGAWRFGLCSRSMVKDVKPMLCPLMSGNVFAPITPLAC